MLSSLSIRNVVLIEALDIAFETGFSALTGETGAGKSILLDSLGLALGARAESGLVRKGADQAQVSAVFGVPDSHPVHALLKEQGLESEETLILRRIVKADGSSRAFINDQPVSIGLLKQAGDMLVEIHGQFETQGLLDPKTHRLILDEYAGIDGAALSQSWQAWKEAQGNLSRARADMEQARAQEEYLRQALETLDELSPQEGEEDRLAALRERLMKRTQIMENLNAAHDMLGQADSLAGKAAHILERLGDDGAALAKGLDGASAELRDVIGGIQSLSADLEECDDDLESVDDRLFALRSHARRHGCAVAELPAIRSDLARQLDMIEAQDDFLEFLVKAAEKTKGAYIQKAGETSALRKKAAKRLDGLVQEELPPLRLEKAQFVTMIDALEENAWGPHGMDGVRFLIATNPGAAPGPLHKIASGGEMARFMLALKVVLAAIGVAGTLVFDEVDTGIGGATASAVGERLAVLSRSRQILVVTHAPQVAARAAHHFIVMKDGQKDVRTKIIPLDEVDTRREEIARMLSGAEISPEARAAAGKLLETGT